MLELHRKKRLYDVFLLCGHRPVMESGVDRFVSPKDPWSWVGLVTKPWFCWYGPPMTWRYLNCPSGPVIRMLSVITMSTREGVKTQLVRKGQAFNILEDLQFSLRGSWTYNLSTSAEFMSHWPMENINQSLPEAHHSMAANPVCKHFIFLTNMDYPLKKTD